MIRGPEALWQKFDAQMAAQGMAKDDSAHYRKWLRYYLDFCHKYGHAYACASSLPLFLDKLISKRQTASQCRQADEAVRLYCGMLEGTVGNGDATQSQPVVPAEVREVPSTFRASGAPSPGAGVGGTAGTDHNKDRTSWSGLSWSEPLAALTNAIKLRHYSPKTLSTYTMWGRRFQAFTGSKAPADLCTEDVKAFLTNLAVVEGVAASTQNQAFNALLFFFRHVLGKEFGKVEGVVRSKRRPYIPVVLSREEIDRVLGHLEPPFDLIVKLLYGCGLRISECLQLRVGCFNLDAAILTIHDGKGQKDRTVPLPQALVGALQGRLVELADLHQADLARGYAGVFLPSQLEKKYRNAPKQFVWQWFFPAKRLSHVVKDHEYRRYHMQPSHANTALRVAVQRAAIPKRVSAHTFRHSFASHLLQANYDIRTIQELLGHSDVRTTMIYTHTVPSRTLKERQSPLDF